jgi:ribosomal protein S12 methylthiotransferase accessory factor
MEPMTVTFPGGLRVDATCGDFVIRTDQPADEGGDGSAPAPFDYFVAALATCAGFYVLSFLRTRGLPAADARLEVHTSRDDETGMLTDVTLRVVLPAGFPDRYRAVIAKAVDHCSVKRHLGASPIVRTEVAILAPAA